MTTPELLLFFVHCAFFFFFFFFFSFLMLCDSLLLLLVLVYSMITISMLRTVLNRSTGRSGMRQGPSQGGCRSPPPPFLSPVRLRALAPFPLSGVRLRPARGAGRRCRGRAPAWRCRSRSQPCPWPAHDAATRILRPEIHGPCARAIFAKLHFIRLNPS